MMHVYGCIMRESGNKNNYLTRWGLKKLNEGWIYEQTLQAIKKMHKKSLKEIKELVKI